MQLFNGITMGKFKIFGFRFDVDTEPSDVSTSNINNIQVEIGQLINNVDNDDEISWIESILTVEVEKYFVQ